MYLHLIFLELLQKLTVRFIIHTINQLKTDFKKKMLVFLNFIFSMISIIIYIRFFLPNTK